MEELQSKVTKHDDCHSSKATPNKGGWQTPFGCVILYGNSVLSRSTSD
jgi:hypothetical protein